MLTFYPGDFYEKTVSFAVVLFIAFNGMRHN